MYKEQVSPLWVADKQTDKHGGLHSGQSHEQKTDTFWATGQSWNVMRVAGDR